MNAIVLTFERDSICMEIYISISTNSDPIAKNSGSKKEVVSVGQKKKKRDFKTTGCLRKKYGVADNRYIRNGKTQLTM